MGARARVVWVRGALAPCRCGVWHSSVLGARGGRGLPVKEPGLIATDMCCGECDLGIADDGGRGRRRQFGDVPASSHPLKDGSMTWKERETQSRAPALLFFLVITWNYR